ncbi:hypothetical protein [Aeromonas dhakensis]|uniref:hypothetical protein n=1 Tax=Aeromonas dhakensis TaxID=196024 RepID=UPI001CF0954D|nr:hypothetical protein [Aeromonas dhakensis]UCM45048.1 hypothetical protein LEO73_21385 [Aeromonas dhakensis]
MQPTVFYMVDVPSVRDDDNGFYRFYNMLFSIELHQGIQYNITFSFEKCNFAGFNMAILLGVFLWEIKKNPNIYVYVNLATQTMNKQVYLKLRNMRLFNDVAQGVENGYIPEEELIPYKSFYKNEGELVVLDYLKEKWIGVNRINFSREVETSVMSSLWEIFANAFEHSHSSEVHCCGSYDKKEKILTLIVGDIGDGIITSVNGYLKQTLSPQHALEWALAKGNSTYTLNLRESGREQPRGLGFEILRQLVDVNNGSMEIYTSSIHYHREKKANTYSNRDKLIKGTWVKLRLHCKNNVLYCFKDELPNYPEYF